MVEGTTPPWPVRPALFLDLDGTVLEIAAEPDQVTASARLRALLPELKEATDGAVAMVSGRPIAEIDRLLAPHVFAAAGIHGLERRDASGRRAVVEADARVLANVRERVAGFAARHQGLLLEDKRVSIALHYRKRFDLADDVGRFIVNLARGLPPGFEILSGRRVFEIKPKSMDKGGAIRMFMCETPFTGRTPVFVGDDVTDETAFQAVNKAGGVSIKVHRGATAARWRLQTVSDVLDWLERSIAARVDATLGANA